MSEIVNRVAQSAIVSLNLEESYPREERLEFDLKPFLFQELILKEKDFRASLKELDWSAYSDKWVAINCSADAMQLTKLMIAEVQEKSLDEALRYAAEMNAKARTTKDCKAGIDAFLSKQKIKW